MTIARRIMFGALDRTPPSLVRAMASSYCAGTTAAEAARAVRELQRQGARATVSALGEAATSEAGAAKHLDEIRSVLAEALDVRLGVKLTGLGLTVSRELAERNLVRLAEEAGARVVEVDMERHEFVDDTLAIVRAARAAGHMNVTAVVQAVSAPDGGRRRGPHPRRNPHPDRQGRLPPGRAPRLAAARVRRASVCALTRRYLEAGVELGIGTHDEYLVVRALEDIVRLGAEVYEFQMIMGVQSGLRDGLLAMDRPVRVTVHFGEELHLWSIRRLKENPEIARYACQRPAGDGGRPIIRRIDLVADVGESFGDYVIGDDFDPVGPSGSANVACGFHAGDPRTMDATVKRCVGAGHLRSAPIRASRTLSASAGGRCSSPREELRTDVLYQMGALAAFARAAGGRLDARLAAWAAGQSDRHRGRTTPAA